MAIFKAHKKRPALREDSWELFKKHRLTEAQKRGRAEWDRLYAADAARQGEEKALARNLKDIAEVEAFFGRPMTAMEFRALNTAMWIEVSLGFINNPDGEPRKALAVAKEIFSDAMLEKTGIRDGEAIQGDGRPSRVPKRKGA